LVVDGEALAERAAPALGDDAGDHVVAAAGGHRHDVADRPGGISLREREAGQCDGGGCGLQQVAAFHGACLQGLRASWAAAALL
jgi:hypothetical protein